MNDPKDRTPQRRLLLAGGAIALVGGALTLFSCNGQQPPPPPLRPVKLVTVGTASVAPVVELAGEVRARVESKLGFRIPGKIVSRRVEAGQRVKRGDELARLDARDFELAQAAAASIVTARQADLDNARSELRRFEDLHRQGHVADSQVDRVRVAVAAAEAALRGAQSSAALESNRVGDAVLRADADGVITFTVVDAGEVVEPGAPVVVLAQDGPREIVVEFPEDRTPLARVARAEVSLWAQPGVKYPAQLRELSASADPVTRTFRARYSVQAPANALALGQSATLTLRLPAQKGGMRLPTTALTEAQGMTQVWVFDPATSSVKHAPVQVVGLDGNEVIVGGLADGAQVVVAGVHVLAEGQKVRPLESQP